MVMDHRKESAMIAVKIPGSSIKTAIIFSVIVNRRVIAFLKATPANRRADLWRVPF